MADLEEEYPDLPAQSLKNVRALRCFTEVGLAAYEEMIRANERERQARVMDTCAVNADVNRQRPGIEEHTKQWHIAEMRSYRWAARLLRGENQPTDPPLVIDENR